MKILVASVLDGICLSFEEKIAINWGNMLVIWGNIQYACHSE